MASAAASGSLPTHAFAASFSRLKGFLFDTYRPELHYMRGPGPKCREKLEQSQVLGRPVAPVTDSLAGQRQLARKLLREWLPSGVASFTVGIVLQNLLFAVTPPKSSAPAGDPKPVIIAAAPSPVEVAEPVDEPRTTVAASPAAPPRPAAVETEASKPQQRFPVPRKRPHESTFVGSTHQAGRPAQHSPTGSALTAQKPIIAAPRAAPVDELISSPQPFSIAELNQKLQANPVALEQSAPCHDTSGWLPRRCIKSPERP